MSWIDRVNHKLIIRTGDGRAYYPLWTNATKEIEYNISEFDFPDVDGTLVKRGNVKGAKYTLQIVFQGEDHLDVAKSFEISARDKREWTIQHPLYDQIIVQPASMTIDNTKDNVSQFTCLVIETIEDDNPRSVTDEQSQLLLDREAMNASYLDAYEFTYIKTNESNNLLIDNVDSVYNEGKKVIDDDESNDIFVNFYNEAHAALVDNVSTPVQQALKVQNFINSLANLPINVQSRINAYTSMFNALPLVFTTKSERVVYENNAGMMISSMAISAATPLTGNYLSRIQVILVIDILYTYLNLYLTKLDELQSTNYSSPDSYVPDPQSLFNLTSLVNKTIASLFKIALGAKQERIIYLDKSSNLILLTHRFYGLDVDDANLEMFKNTNSIGINEILNIKKGRRIVYYI